MNHKFGQDSPACLYCGGEPGRDVGPTCTWGPFGRPEYRPLLRSSPVFDRVAYMCKLPHMDPLEVTVFALATALRLHEELTSKYMDVLKNGLPPVTPIVSEDQIQVPRKEDK